MKESGRICRCNSLFELQAMTNQLRLSFFVLQCTIVFVHCNFAYGQEIENGATYPSTKPAVRFEYREPPYGPIKENWTATITKFSKTKNDVTVQKITETKYYEPGMYHVEIGTFPLLIMNYVLDSNIETVIKIHHPGYAKFVPNESTSRKVTLYQLLGDRYFCFYSLDLSDPRSQHFEMQPGDYQVHYRNSSNRKKEKKVTFKIQPGEETTVDLK